MTDVEHILVTIMVVLQITVLLSLLVGNIMRFIDEKKMLKEKAELLESIFNDLLDRLSDESDEEKSDDENK